MSPYPLQKPNRGTKECDRHLPLHRRMVATSSFDELFLGISLSSPFIVACSPNPNSTPFPLTQLPPSPCYLSFLKTRLPCPLSWPTTPPPPPTTPSFLPSLPQLLTTPPTYHPPSSCNQHLPNLTHMGQTKALKMGVVCTCGSFLLEAYFILKKTLNRKSNELLPNLTQSLHQTF